MNELHTLNQNENIQYLKQQNLKPFMVLGGINTLVAAAMPLILFVIKLKKCEAVQNVDQLKNNIVNEIMIFEQRASKSGYKQYLIFAACYCLCVALDEVVLSTAWGFNASWGQQSLLSLIYQETWGGERFFIILKNISNNPKAHNELLVLIYIILSLGFEGKYYNQDKSVHEEIKQQLFNMIRLSEINSNQTALPDKNPIQSVQLHNRSLVKPWKIFTLTGCVLFSIGILFNILTYHSAENALNLMNTILHSTNRIQPQLPNKTNKNYAKHGYRHKHWYYRWES